MILPFGTNRRVSILPRTSLFDSRAKKTKAAHKRRAPTQLKISEESQAALKVRLASAEGRQYLNEFAKLIVEWAARSMPTELLQPLVEEKGHETLKGLWPDIVDAYFKALSNPARQN